VRGAESVVALVLLEWTTGWVGAAAWTQSWGVVRRGHFRITSWLVVALAVLSAFAYKAASTGDPFPPVVIALVAGAGAYLVAQYLRSDRAAAVAGGVATVPGVGALATAASSLESWSAVLGTVTLVIGAAFVGAITNGMMLGHWYLNQPGLKPWALARLTKLALGATAASALLGLAAASRLASAETSGAVLGLAGFGDSFGLAFYLIWLTLLVFSGVVVWMARRCINIRSIQSATGLYYVAILTAGVAEFLVRYLMVNAA